MRIICLDDHRAMLDSLVEELKTISPYSAIQAFQDSETALEFAEANGCDVLFCEINLCGRDGVMIAEKMKKINPRLNIIFTTVCEESERAKEVFRLHPSGYITKPYTHDQLAAELKALRYPVEEKADAFHITSSPAQHGSTHTMSPGMDIRRGAKPSEEFSFVGSRPYTPGAAPVSRAPYKPAAEVPEQTAAEEPKAQAVDAKDLRRLGRAELLEMLITQTKENDKLRARLRDAENKLEKKALTIENAGSIAQAALQMNGVFEAAQRAADQYVESVQLQSLQMSIREKENAERCGKMLADARARCSIMESDTAKKCEDMVRNAEAEAKVRWEELYQKMEAYLKEHEQLRSLMLGAYKK